MSSKQPAQGTFDRHHAVVIGGSMAGLLAARVLSDHCGWFHTSIPASDTRDIKTPWLLSTGEDLRYPGAEGKRSLSIRLLNRYMHRVIELTASDPRVTATLLRVRNLLKPLSTLFQPRIILAVLRQELAAFRQQPSVTAPASEVRAPVYNSYEPLHSKV